MTEAADFSEAWIETADGRTLPLRANCRIGRKPDSDIVIDSEKASRKHALIHAQDGSEYWLVDLSTNGTFLNGQRIMRPTRLHNGDRIVVAHVAFHFRQEAGSCLTEKTTLAGNATVMDLAERHAWLVVVDIIGSTVLSRELPPNEFASRVGGWIEKGQRLVELAGGRISKFLGDGFLACWDAGDQVPAVVDALEGFHDLQERSAVPFRTVVHHGPLTFCGRVQLGEETIVGPDFVFIFRLEKLAAELKLDFCASAAAHARLENELDFEEVPGEHIVKDFPGHHRCFRIVWP
jgi:class 3 adenylate cyclase